MNINDYTREEKDRALDEAWELMNPKVETNAERLEEVKRNTEIVTSYLAYIGVDDFKWLIMQADENKRLRERIKELGK